MKQYELGTNDYDWTTFIARNPFFLIRNLLIAGSPSDTFNWPKKHVGVHVP